MAVPTPRAPRVSIENKIDSICSLIQQLNLTPKSFLVSFLEHDSGNASFRQRMWGSKSGWDSTLDLILKIKKLACHHREGHKLWEGFILSEAIDIVSSQKPESGEAPNGSYHNSRKLSDSLFTDEERDFRNRSLTESMPFLYQLICAKIKGDLPEVAQMDGDLEGLDNKNPNDSDDGMQDLEGNFIQTISDPSAKRAKRAETIARTICAIVAFGANRLASSQRTAHSALSFLGKRSKEKLKERSKLNLLPLFAPIVCYDNLDFQVKVHTQSVAHTSKMFHGTWGYIHSVPPWLLQGIDPAEVSISAMKQALHDGTKLKIRPNMFTPTMESTKHWEKTLKSQITQAILRYLAEASDNKVKLHSSPLEVSPIAPDDPDIMMLKLMLASDNSSQGVGEVFTGVIEQSGLTPAEFHSRLQIIEGDLGSCNIFQTLRNQQTPSLDSHNSLDNIIAIPGAAHTIWNVSQSLFLNHWGNEKLAYDTGAWRTLHALGVPIKDKPTTKKDFYRMLSDVERIHEVTLL
ncbi:hypothetical protein PCANC_03168 [Puccinia coronata f. sp. avenae]|uniref:DUF6589 domain-containing protein n=1 Tax=Puccinia coronata f. sp. avenae TaxID=200324 RepID=A0A2N5T834_9BASI|nr:hypothetical protein PCANC_03168 [Puccinia coronata f. sp. avenae]